MYPDRGGGRGRLVTRSAAGLCRVPVKTKSLVTWPGYTARYCCGIHCTRTITIYNGDWNWETLDDLFGVFGWPLAAE